MQVLKQFGVVLLTLQLGVQLLMLVVLLIVQLLVFQVLQDRVLQVYLVRYQSQSQVQLVVELQVYLVQLDLVVQV